MTTKSSLSSSSLVSAAIAAALISSPCWFLARASARDSDRAPGSALAPAAAPAAIEASVQSSVAQLPDCPDLARALQDLLRADTRLRDFANLQRYRDDDRSVGPAKGRVVFMGDSITDNWKLGGFFPSKPYINRGISGQTTPQMLLRFRQDVIALGPDIVVILAGTNDIAGNTGPMTDDDIKGNLMSMAELAAANRIRVVLASITPVSDYHGRPPAQPMTGRRPPARILALNSWMKTYAINQHQVYLDYHSAMVDDHGMLRSEFSEDDLHPNARGYAIMAPLAEAAIQRARSGS